MRAKSKPSPSIPATVRLTPSTAIDPFSTTYRSNGGGAEIATRVEPSAMG
jgi:hypothetical protein